MASMRTIYLSMQQILPLRTAASAAGVAAVVRSTICPQLQRTITFQFLTTINIYCGKMMLFVPKHSSPSDARGSSSGNSRGGRRRGKSMEEELDDGRNIKFQTRGRSMTIFVKSTERVLSSRDTIVCQHLREVRVLQSRRGSGRRTRARGRRGEGGRARRGRDLYGVHDEGRGLRRARGRWVKRDRGDVSHLKLSWISIGDEMATCWVHCKDKDREQRSE
jgi:hypothetical protein